MTPMLTQASQSVWRSKGKYCTSQKMLDGEAWKHDRYVGRFKR